MKKILYYIAPFVIIPLSLLLFELIAQEVIKTNGYFFLNAILLIICIVIGNLSPSHNKFDYIITLLLPLSLFCFMFIVGFLDSTETYARFSFERALNVALQTDILVTYFIMLIASFWASFKPFRIMKKIKI